MGLLFDDLCCCSSNSELSAGVLERNKGYYNTPLGRSDGSGGYTYSSRGGNSGGRWDTRSTGSSDRDGEVPDRESLAQGNSSFFLGMLVIEFLFCWFLQSMVC